MEQGGATRRVSLSSPSTQAKEDTQARSLDQPSSEGVGENEVKIAAYTGNGLFTPITLTMQTPSPTTRPVFSGDQLLKPPLDPVTSGLRFLGGRDPTDPLIARERRNIAPYRSRRRRLNQGLSQIPRHGMYHTTGDFVVGLSNHPFCGPP